MRFSPAIESLLVKAVDPSSFSPDGIYTRPRSWGVYEISPPESGRATRRFRLGNHPIREHELLSELGSVRVIAVYTTRTLAESLASLLNADD